MNDVIQPLRTAWDVKNRLQVASWLGQSQKHQRERIRQQLLSDPSIPQKYKGRSKPISTPSPLKGIDFARLSQASYHKGTERNVEGYNILEKYSSPDRVVYQHKDTGHVIIAFRGTDTHHKSNFWRDASTDALLAGGFQDYSYRFRNSTDVTKQVIKQYGVNNVSLTGHSLGGSQAMYISNKTGAHAEVYNPHTDYQASITNENYFNTNLHVNYTDPVATFFPGAHFQNVDARYNKKASPGIPQHAIGNFTLPVPPKPSPGPAPVPPKPPTPPQQHYDRYSIYGRRVISGT